jgi:hypothetical protein
MLALLGAVAIFARSRADTEAAVTTEQEPSSTLDLHCDWVTPRYTHIKSKA